MPECDPLTVPGWFTCEHCGVEYWFPFGGGTTYDQMREDCKHGRLCYECLGQKKIELHRKSLEETRVVQSRKKRDRKIRLGDYMEHFSKPNDVLMTLEDDEGPCFLF